MTTKFLFLEGSKVEHKIMNVIPISTFQEAESMRCFYLSSSAHTCSAPAIRFHRVQLSGQRREEKATGNVEMMGYPEVTNLFPWNK